MGCAKETGERVMIENNRNHINVQSCSVGAALGRVVGNDHRFQGSVISPGSKTSIMIMILITRSDYRL